MFPPSVQKFNVSDCQYVILLTKTKSFDLEKDLKYALGVTKKPLYLDKFRTLGVGTIFTDIRYFGPISTVVSNGIVKQYLSNRYSTTNPICVPGYAKQLQSIHYYTHDKFLDILKNIDSLKYGFRDSFSISKCKKVFEELVHLQDYQNSFFEIERFTFFPSMHPVVEILTIYFYMNIFNSSYAYLYFKFSLRQYMGFFLNEEYLNEIPKFGYLNLMTFVFNGLFVLDKAVNSSRKYLIHYFNNFHFSRHILLKEYSETLSVFNLINYMNKSIVNICSGNAVGTQFLDRKITCVDWKKYIGMQLLINMNVCDFVQCDIMEDDFETTISLFDLCVAIHACRDLSIRIIKVFQTHAPDFSKLYIVPCCNMNKTFYKENLNNYDRIYRCFSKNKRNYAINVMHFEYLCSLCHNEFKIKTLHDMQSEKNKMIIVSK